MPAESSDTPMLRQYREIKEQHKDAILFYRIGDFYEMFYDDAVTAAKVLDIVLTSRNKNDPNPVPLCGIPHHSYQPYLEKLVEKGYKVAVCDQVEDPKEAKGVVRREVVRVVTPGLAGFLDGVDRSQKTVHQYLASVHRDGEVWGIAFLDIATGDFRCFEIPGTPETLLGALSALEPRELVVSEGVPVFDPFKERYCLSRTPVWVWDETYARKILCDQFQVATLSGFGCEAAPAGVIAAGAILHYVRETQKVGRMAHLRPLKLHERKESMAIGEDSRKNLNVDDLSDFLDATKTAMGARKFRDWLLAPLLRKEAIEARLDAVEELVGRPRVLEAVQSCLQNVYDLERINSRLSLGTANARDLRALADSLEALSRLKPILSELKAGLFAGWIRDWYDAPLLKEKILKTLVETPPLALKDGGIVRDGVSPELDELRKIQTDAKGSIAAIEERERQRTGIGSLKVRFNQVFGYYLEVTAAHLSKVPADFIRKQTLANAERYITPELKSFEDKVLGAEERIKGLEYKLFCDLRDAALAEVPELQAQADRVAELDALQSFSEYARSHRTVRPVLHEDGRLKISQGRHPLVEKNLPAGSFVPNDLSMDVAGDRFLMITGPNMAGKSTVIRSAGVLTLMAQAGSFVPAEVAEVGIVDQIFTRVGAADRLARGESTFMVEMCETANILHNATERSLVLLDEIGRGTSTFDGISIAWAVAEYLHDALKSRTLFATHYHELIDLALTRPGIKNYNVQVKQEGDDVVFLYRLVAGGMNHSFGIHVARLAGLPPEVVERAKEVLKNLESGELEPEGQPRIAKRRNKRPEGQGDLF
ncbi:MAG TPA: DNA mismatch repair protein MutS [bacterium]|nr:DNA mismatch repair protein MutS [bacterium]